MSVAPSNGRDRSAFLKFFLASILVELKCADAIDDRSEESACPDWR
jgi:hypothetical protein